MSQQDRSPYFSIALLIVIGLSSCATSHGPLGPISHITVTEAGSDSEAESCQDFAVTDHYVESFFRRAILITHGQEHDYFLHGPCYMRGTLTSKYGDWHWEIRNLGTAQVISASGDDSFLFADPQQESPLAVE
jgi:hypothetical protein